MKTKILVLLAAMLLFSATTVMAQSDNTESEATETALNGDVNGDGIVDVADIAAVIAVMKAQGSIETKYYWYVGQTNPADNSTITSTVGAEGWRLISNPNEISKSNPLFDTTTSSEEAIVGSKSDYWYIALPVDKSYKIYDSDYADQIAAGNFEKQTSTVNFGNVDYIIYKGVGQARKWWGYTIY